MMLLQSYLGLSLLCFITAFGEPIPGLARGRSWLVRLSRWTKDWTLDRDPLDTLDRDLLDLERNYLVSLTSDLLVPASASNKGHGKLVTCWVGFLQVGYPLSTIMNPSNRCLSDEVLSMNLINFPSNFHSVRHPPLSHNLVLILARNTEILGVVVRYMALTNIRSLRGYCDGVHVRN